MKSVEILTAQKVSLQYDVASLFERILAWIIDFVIIMVSATVLNLVVNMLLGSMGSYDGTPKAIADVLISLPWFFYHYLFETFNHGRSLGKMALGLQVVKLSGENVTANDYFIRWAFRLIDIALSIGGLALILIATSNKGQRVGDALANTTVVRTRPRLNFRLKEIMEINSLENYSPVYAEAKYFSDKDMLLVKQVLERYKSLHGETEKQLLHETTVKVCEKMREPLPRDEVSFLRTVIKDYIVLTR